MPREGAPVEAVEGAAALPSFSERQAAAAGSKPPLPGAPKGPASTRNRRYQRREGHPYEIFFPALATAPAAMSSSTGAGDRRSSGFVPQPVATLWNGFVSGSGSGANGDSARSERDLSRKTPGPYGDDNLPISSGHIALAPDISITSACVPHGEEGGARLAEVGAASFSLLLHKRGLRARGWK
jgi:hypothetical protein